MSCASSIVAIACLLTLPVWLFTLINTFNRDPHDVFQGDTSKAGEKWRISWEQGELCTDWWSADPSNSQVHDQGKYMHQKRAPSYIAAPVLTGPTPTAGSGLTIQPQLAQAMKLRLLALCGCNKPRQSSQQHKPLLAVRSADQRCRRYSIWRGGCSRACCR